MGERETEELMTVKGKISQRRRIQLISQPADDGIGGEEQEVRLEGL